MIYSGAMRYQVFLTGIFLLLVSFISCQNGANDSVNEDGQRRESLFKYARTLRDTPRPASSISYLDSVYAANKNASVLDLWYKYDFKRDYYAETDVKSNLPSVYVDSMLRIMQGRENLYKLEYARSLFHKGGVLLTQKKYSEAFQYFYSGRRFAQKNLDSCSYAQMTEKIGLVMYNQGNYVKAIPYFRTAFQENRQCSADADFQNRFILPQSLLNTIGLCYERMNKADSAILYYRKALSFISAQEKKNLNESKFISAARGVIYGNLGGVYAVKLDYDSAEKYLQKSIDINEQPGFYNEDARTAKNKLAALYIQFSQYKKADVLLGELQGSIDADDAKHIDDYYFKMKLSKLRWDYYDRNKDYLSAYKYSQDYYKLHDSLIKANAFLTNDYLNESYENSERQHSLELSKKDNKLKTVYLLATSGVSFLGIVILIVVYLSMKRYRGISKIGAEQNLRLQETLAALEQSQQENTSLMRIVAHDLRNPIGGITMMAEMILKEPNLPGEVKTMAELIKTSGDNSMALVTDLLNSNVSFKELKKEVVEVHKMLAYCADILTFKAAEKGQKLIVKSSNSQLTVNTEKIWRVISNLIANAIKFSPNGTRILVNSTDLGDKVLIWVQDFGIGIPAELQEELFDMYADTKRAGTSGEKPYGMGLAICKQIVQAHNGRIWCVSEKGNGTTFYVELPKYARFAD